MSVVVVVKSVEVVSLNEVNWFVSVESAVSVDLEDNVDSGALEVSDDSLDEQDIMEPAEAVHTEVSEVTVDPEVSVYVVVSVDTVGLVDPEGPVESED